MIAELLLAADLSLAAFAGQAAEPPQVVYRGAWVIDGTGAGPTGPMSILVKGERIEKVWDASQMALKLPPDTKVVDVTGLYAEHQAAGIGAKGERADTYPFVVDLRGVDPFRKLTGLLAAPGIKPRVIDKILGSNFVDYAQRVWG